jgi:asparagine synthase (glutamine-hydrolysing)
MVQTRLAIIDLVTGDQPLYEPDGAALIANGEIYNYIELRGAFANTQFATNSDCETPLHLYRRDGLDFARDLRGMYAIALHDPGRGQLVVARDPFGIKPMYYAETPAGFAFASQPTALFAAGIVQPRLKANKRDELLQLQFTTGRETIFDGVQRVLPGETLAVTAGRVVDRRRIAALAETGPADWSEDEALKRLDDALTDSVTVHQRADVPYGMFLSGGIDSSALLVLMARLNGRPVRAFTAGFSAPGAVDERDHARAVAKALGAEHVEVEFGEDDFWTLLPQIAATIDDPASDYAMLPTYKLAREAAKELKVVLTGEGGDEMLAGYGRYRAVTRPWWRGGRTMRVRGALDGLGVLRTPSLGWRDGVAASEIIASQSARTRLQIAQAVDCADWLPNDLLVKLDRCLMAHGMEGRTPFLDPAVADVAFRLPDSLKVRNGMGKWLLRKWLADRLPIANPFGKKRGFTVPIGPWIEKKGNQLGPLVARQPGIAEACDPDAVIRLFSAHGKHAAFAAWSLLFYALWHQVHIAGRKPDGDALAVLA